MCGGGRDERGGGVGGGGEIAGISVRSGFTYISLKYEHQACLHEFLHELLTVQQEEHPTQQLHRPSAIG